MARRSSGDFAVVVRYVPDAMAYHCRVTTHLTAKGESIEVPSTTAYDPTHPDAYDTAACTAIQRSEAYRSEKATPDRNPDRTIRIHRSW